MIDLRAPAAREVLRHGSVLSRLAASESQRFPRVARNRYVRRTSNRHAFRYDVTHDGLDTGSL